MDEEEERRRIGVAMYYVRSEREANEAHALARLAGYKRFAHLVFEVVDTKLAELRARFPGISEPQQ